jgi:GDP-D-mannose dehydratase
MFHSLIGDYSKEKKKLGWEGLKQDLIKLVEIMVKEEINRMA